MNAPLPERPKHVKKIKLRYGYDPLKQGFYWPDSAQKRSEVMQIRRSAPDVFESTYQCRPGKREGSIFLADDLNAFFTCANNGIPFPPADLSLGIHSPLTRDFISRGHSLLQAWDTAFSTSLQSAHTVCVTGLLVPCSSYHRGEDPAILGPCEFHFDVLLLNVFRRRLDWGGLVTNLKTQYHIFRPQELLIEKKASGISLIQSLESSGLPIVPMEATASKGARAINSVTTKTAGSVQGWFRQHRVLCPTQAPWLDAWRAEMKDFSGNDDASSDQVDATVHLVTRAIILGSNSVQLSAEWAPERVGTPGYLDPAAPTLESSNDPRSLKLAWLGRLPDLTEDPFSGTCSRCIQHGDKFCAIQGRRMLAMDSCEQFSDTAPTDINVLSDAVRIAGGL